MPRPTVDHPNPKPPAKGYHAPGLRRVRLILWRLYSLTPLDQPIDGQAEQAAAAAVKMAFSTYEQLKVEHPDLWAKAAKKRALAVANGYFPPQPPQLARYRREIAWRKKANPRKLLRRNNLVNSKMCVSPGKASHTASAGKAPGRQLRPISLGIPPRESTPKLWPTAQELAARLARRDALAAGVGRCRP